MKKSILFFLCCFSISLSPCIAAPDEVVLKHVASLDLVIEELAKADTETLVIFDVDYVLLVPKDLLARPCGHKFRHEAFPKLEKEVGKDKLKYLFSLLRSQSRAELVDVRLPELIKELQARSIKVVALTGQGYGPLGIIKDEGALRVEELKKLDIDFRNVFPDLKPFFLTIASVKDQPPLYRDGIIFTDHSSKGETLIAFLKKLQWTPKKIIVIDDGREHLKHIQEALHANGLKGLLFHYEEGKLAAEHLDPEIAKFQLDYLIKNEKWLSDEEAQRLLEKNSEKL